MKILREKPISLLTIEKIRWKAVEKRHQVYTSEWKPFFDAGQPLKELWGYLTHKSKKQIILFSFSEYGVSHDYISKNNNKYIYTLPIEEIPLFIGNIESLPEEKQRIIKGRLDGSIPQALYRQDLVDLYLSADKKMSHQNNIIGHCNEAIKRYMINKAYESLGEKKRFHSHYPIKLTLNNRVYFCVANSSDPHFVGPEEEYLDIPESTVLQDEASNPNHYHINPIEDSPFYPKQKSNRERKVRSPRPPKKGRALRL